MDYLDAIARPNTPRWIKRTLTYSDLATAGLTNDVELYSLPAGGVVHAIKAKHSAAFTGGLISAYTISVGISGSFAKYLTAFSTFGAPVSTPSFQESPAAEDHASATSIRAQAISIGANLNAATAGAIDVWLLVSVAK